VKYTGLEVCGALAVALLVGLRGAAPGRRSGALLRFIVAGAVVGSPFYIRNVFERGNPVFPFAYDLFGGRGWDSWRAWGYAAVLSRYGHGRELADFVWLPIRLLTANEPKSGFEASLGPAVALGALISGAALIRPVRSSIFPDGRAVLLTVGLIVMGAAFWALTTQQGRMFLTTVPLLLALVAAALTGLRAIKSWMATSLLAYSVAAALLWAVPAGRAFWKQQGTSEWLAGRVDAETALSVLLPDTYPVERELQQFVPVNGKVWLVWMHNYTYYLRRPWRADQIFEDERFSDALDASPTPAAFAAKLAADGIAAVLINERFFLADDSADRGEPRTGRLRQRFEQAMSAGVLVPVTRRREVTLYRVSSR
jgi:hypothetical protein